MITEDLEFRSKVQILFMFCENQAIGCNLEIR